ncbi:MAG: low molecular weight phosphotyrosine protein phosphatase [Clostridia bacterium]|nr:low molecular weight phosphotyrosine protein phosphatase [Clostridia bacterium]
MVSVIFVCLGNICRSPMGEMILKKMVEEKGLAHSFCITSAGTSDCEEGNPVYPPAVRALKAHGLPYTHTARQLTKKDVINNDYILVMDSENLFDVLRLTSGEFGEKIFKLCSFTPSPRDVADPWITGDFETAFNDITEGCGYFLEYLLREKAEMFGYDKRH